MTWTDQDYQTIFEGNASFHKLAPHKQAFIEKCRLKSIVATERCSLCKEKFIQGQQFTQVDDKFYHLTCSP